MIRIEKSGNIPSILKTKGEKAKETLCKLYNDNPELFLSKEKKEKDKKEKSLFDPKLYGDGSVKKQLIMEQNDKCCFCESKISAISHGDVEHFRPKAAISINGKLTYPGYYWLAYDWENLFFSCQICNQTYKKNEFPLEDETSRVTNHHNVNEIENEKTLLIHPSKENPEEHIYYEQEIAKGKDEKGKTSIRVFGLDRKELEDKRRDKLNLIKPYRIIAQTDISKIKSNDIRILEKLNEAIEFAKETIIKSMQSDHEYSGMFRSNYSK